MNETQNAFSRTRGIEAVTLPTKIFILKIFKSSKCQPRVIFSFFNLRFSFLRSYSFGQSYTCNTVSCERVRFIRLVLKLSDSYAWYRLVSYHTYIRCDSKCLKSLSSYFHRVWYVHVWYTCMAGYRDTLQVCFIHAQYTCTPGIIYFYHTAYTLSTLRYVFTYAFAHSFGAVLVYFHKINVSSCFVRFVQRFHLGVRIVCSS